MDRILSILSPGNVAQTSEAGASRSAGEAGASILEHTSEIVSDDTGEAGASETEARASSVHGMKRSVEVASVDDDQDDSVLFSNDSLEPPTKRKAKTKNLEEVSLSQDALNLLNDKPNSTNNITFRNCH